jgi:hypothetical protein
VDAKSKKLSGEEENRVWHYPEEDALEFLELRRKNKNPIKKVFFTNTISPQNKIIFSSKPYNGKEVSE